MDTINSMALSVYAERALRVLRDGGYFRAKKSTARNYEQAYYTRLFTAEGIPVEMPGHATVLNELLEVGIAAVSDAPTALWGKNRAVVEQQFGQKISATVDPKEIIYTLSKKGRN